MDHSLTMTWIEPDSLRTVYAKIIKCLHQLSASAILISLISSAYFGHCQQGLALTANPFILVHKSSGATGGLSGVTFRGSCWSVTVTDT